MLANFALLVRAQIKGLMHGRGATVYFLTVFFFRDIFLNSAKQLIAFFFPIVRALSCLKMTDEQTKVKKSCAYVKRRPNVADGQMFEGPRCVP